VPGLVLLTGAVLVFLVAPILVIVPLSFSSGSFFYYPLPGVSCAGTRTSLRRRSGCPR
jgi:ABC-type spermidine/putrescine transport system permease subunit II